jgi:hypothetical protein
VRQVAPVVHRSVFTHLQFHLYASVKAASGRQRYNVLGAFPLPDLEIA